MKTVEQLDTEFSREQQRLSPTVRPVNPACFRCSGTGEGFDPGTLCQRCRGFGHGSKLADSLKRAPLGRLIPTTQTVWDMEARRTVAMTCGGPDGPGAESDAATDHAAILAHCVNHLPGILACIDDLHACEKITDQAERRYARDLTLNRLALLREWAEFVPGL